ncbi:MAG TPA: thiosulfate oxidation carrier complex protein SoxZ [Burkholderiales bacterium]|nr:thiosulfate oxidation carrier complex protein SoxZ [Burkholderiales bacterium]
MSEPMKIRAQVSGDVVDVKVLMNHPMETGQRQDPKSGQKIPVHFIQTVTATLNGKTVLDAQWSQAISKNPFLGFKVKGGKVGDKLVITWVDNKGDKRTDEVAVTAAG